MSSLSVSVLKVFPLWDTFILNTILFVQCFRGSLCFKLSSAYNCNIVSDFWFISFVIGIVLGAVVKS